jgi:hypothetical protein
MFINKIHDTQVRYMMLKNILVLVSMEKWFDIFILTYTIIFK